MLLESLTLRSGWATVTDPDPTGARTRLLRRALRAHAHIKGSFWDQASLYQHPSIDDWRTPEQEDSFKSGLEVMGDLYASAVGTTVLQMQDIPSCPDAFDGQLCLFGVAKGVDEARLRKAFGGFGSIVRCERGRRLTVLTFGTHAAALAAKAAGPQAGVCEGVNTIYNELAYGQRGWCSFEEIVSATLLAHLQKFGKIREALGSMPPKVLKLSDANPAGEDVTSLVAVEDHIARGEERIRSAEFTNGADKDMVVRLFRDYAQRTEHVLTKSVEFIEEVKGVPVLLSILVLVFKHRAVGSTEPLPRNYYELYQSAMRTAIAAALPAERAAEVRQMLQRVAVAAHMAGVRDFGASTVKSSGVDEELWQQLAESDKGLPLVKTLEARTTFRFKHLSFQEALFAQAVVDGTVSAQTWSTLDNMEQPFYLNVFKIGGEAMGGVLAKELCASGRRELSLGEHGYKAMLLCLPAALAPPEGDPVPLERLSLGAHELDLNAARKLAPFLSTSRSLKEVRD